MQFAKEALKLAPDLRDSYKALAPLGWNIRGVYFVDQDHNPIDSKEARRNLKRQEWFISPKSNLDIKRKAAVRFAQRWNRLVDNFTKTLMSGGLHTGSTQNGGYKGILKEGVKVLRGVAGKFLSGMGPLGALANQIIPDDPLGALGY